MTTEIEKQKIEENLDEARRGLFDTAEQMRQKVEAVDINPERIIINRYPAASIGITAALGFIAGAALDEIFEPILFGLLLGIGTSRLMTATGNSGNGSS